MKFRAGFVSNSSSSSFAIVGIRNDWGKGPKPLDKLCKQLEIVKDGNMEVAEEKGFWPRQQGSYEAKDGLCLFVQDCDICMIGLSIADELSKDKTVSEMKDCLQAVLAKRGIKVKLSQIRFEVEQFGWG